VNNDGNGFGDNFIRFSYLFNLAVSILLFEFSDLDEFILTNLLLFNTVDY
jgi:hypothetical protein